ncbi:hypothetical protein TUM20985_26180 [Mycobacterium antarcticum]|uniref:DUF1810 domain-containing protein n=1 Tax=unclassified Mycolicibacterium TaxID=2636767 RepID=UPI0023856B54|nr:MULTISPECIES: DUF1810 domain-containing protein [unclassified Mycolicibacterium]BDX32071.1 hypothetical protein TUM20985_26180 [Mycolicibacterium sp. TUM20985]GLP75375.1 hypothetical protein TUM20983_24850 [Mycolicibacterium sp. TUM20983]GLP84361.1 hypothetical protein TUM20984_57810 [Mycolicibacterium sp. TUM20984]
MDDPHQLERFVEAQHPVFDDVLDELRAGRKRSHWMWFVFPQLRGLGSTAMADRYGIGSREEALAYLGHDVLGPRLHQCARLVAQSGAVTAEALMGSVDAMKLASSMTLFAEVTDDDGDFTAVLHRYYGGQRDERTVRMLGPR